jgi:hypothetical protein
MEALGRSCSLRTVGEVHPEAGWGYRRGIYLRTPIGPDPVDMPSFSFIWLIS